MKNYRRWQHMLGLEGTQLCGIKVAESHVMILKLPTKGLVVTYEWKNYLHQKGAGTAELPSSERTVPHNEKRRGRGRRVRSICEGGLRI